MKIRVLLLLVFLPALSYAQGGFLQKWLLAFKKPVRPQLSSKREFVYAETRTLNTAVLFPRPPGILHFRDTTSQTPAFLVKACLTNLKSLNDVRLTLNGEEQSVPAQTLVESSACKGFQYTCPLTLPLPVNTISLEAHNEGGASIHYAVVTLLKP